MIYRQPIILASSSPRRILLLNDAGFEVVVIPPEIDDGKLTRTESDPTKWVMALANLKANSIKSLLTEKGITDCTILGADTVCVVNTEVLGQPKNATEARSMLTVIQNCKHNTITGVCLISMPEDERMLFYDSTTVEVGSISPTALEEYINSGEWQGKAGGYNLADRINAGWPIKFSGDPATVMGLPITRLVELFGLTGNVPT